MVMHSFLCLSVPKGVGCNTLVPVCVQPSAAASCSQQEASRRQPGSSIDRCGVTSLAFATFACLKQPPPDLQRPTHLLTVLVKLDHRTAERLGVSQPSIRP
jgi:hypothetical protein